MYDAMYMAKKDEVGYIHCVYVYTYMYGYNDACMMLCMAPRKMRWVAYTVYMCIHTCMDIMMRV